MEDAMIWLVALVSLALGAFWRRNPRTAFMTWPALGVAGVIVGQQLQSPAITKWTLGLCAAAMVLQIVYDASNRTRPR